MPMMLGSSPADEYALIRASGLSPSCSARLADIIMTAAAPSFRPDALPAVTVPSFENAGRSAASESSVVPCFGYSSVSKVIVPFFCAIWIGTISSLKRPAFCAASALFCEAMANASWSARDTSYFVATFSAVTPMWYWL